MRRISAMCVAGLTAGLMTLLISCKSSTGPDNTGNGGNNQQNPVIALSLNTLSFSGIKSQANPASQSFGIKNSGSGTLQYQITLEEAWLSATPSSGSSTGEWDSIAVAVDTQSLPAGTHSGTVKISCGQATNSPQTVSISLVLQPAPQVTLAKPGVWSAPAQFGSFDFVVDADSANITKITLMFSSWLGRSGGIGVSTTPAWKITDGKFTAEFSILPNPFDAFNRESWSIKGTFSQNGKKASGTWSSTYMGKSYSGSWEGAWKSKS